MRDTEEAGSDALQAPNPAEHNTKEGDVMPASSSKSSRSPAFQFYPKDFLSSSKVDRMSMTERGVYITLLSRYWLDGDLPADAAELASIVRMKPKQFTRMWVNGQLHLCFMERDGRLIQKRLERERKVQADYRKKQKDNADKGWHSRRNATALPESEESHRSGNAPLPRSLPLPRSASAFAKNEERLDVAFREFQNAYPEHRRKGGHLLETAYVDAAHKAGGAAALMCALVNHLASEQWSDLKLVPGMDTWLGGEYWLQVLPVKTGAVVDPKVPAWLRKKA